MVYQQQDTQMFIILLVLFLQDCEELLQQVVAREMVSKHLPNKSEELHSDSQYPCKSWIGLVTRL